MKNSTTWFFLLVSIIITLFGLGVLCLVLACRLIPRCLEQGFMDPNTGYPLISFERYCESAAFCFKAILLKTSFILVLVTSLGTGLCAALPSAFRAMLDSSGATQKGQRGQSESAD